MVMMWQNAGGAAHRVARDLILMCHLSTHGSVELGMSDQDFRISVCVASRGGCLMIFIQISITELINVEDNGYEMARLRAQFLVG
eukprot:4637093-Pleurochrysis_carterae.AAC.3